MQKAILILFISFLMNSFLIAQPSAEDYQKAMNAFEENRFAEAYELFSGFFSTYSETDELSASAKFYSAESLLNLGRTDEASAEYEYLTANFRWTTFRSKALYKLGLIYFNSGQFGKCREKLNQLLDEYPDSEFTGAALYWIGESFARENKLDEAINFLEEAIENKKNNSFIDYTIFTLAGVYEKIGDYNSAVEYYDRLLSFYPNSELITSAQIRIGICYFKLKDYHSSILELNNPILSNLPEQLYSESLLLLANSYYRVEQYEDAANTYLEIINNFPGSELTRAANYGLAWSYFQSGKYNDAFNVFNFLSEGTDTIAEKSFYWKAESKRYSGQEMEAFNLYRDFILRFPNSSLIPGVQFQLGVFYYNSKNFDQAEKYLITAISSDDNPTRAKAYTLLGEISLHRKQFATAMNYFEPVLNITDNSAGIQNRAMLGLGVASYFQNQYRNTIEYLTDIEIRNPSFESDKVNYYLAESYYRLAEYSKALQRYDKINPDNTELAPLSLYGKAYCYMKQNDYQNAAFYFSEFVRKFPEDKNIIDAKLRLADSYYASKNFEASSKVFADLFKAGSAEINDPYVFYQYAQALYKSGKTARAISEFAELQRRFPDSDYADESLFTVGWIYFQQGNYQQAVSSYRNVLQIYPSTPLKPVLYYSIADAFFNLSMYDSAIVNYEKVLTVSPSSDYVYDAINGIQYSYVAQGKPGKAVLLIDEFISKNPNLSYSDQIYYKKGEIYYSERDYEKAISAYKDFIIKYPSSALVADAFYWIGKSSQNIGQKSEAILNFRNVFINYPKSKSAPAAVIELCNIYNDNENYDETLLLLEDALGKLNNTPRLAELKFLKANTLLKKGDFSAAGEVLDDILQNHGETIFGDRAKLEIGLIELAAGRYDNARLYFENLVQSRSDNLAAEAQFYIGKSFFDENLLTDAISALVRVKNVFSSYDEWVTRSYMLLGECYLKLNDIPKAKEMYRQVVKSHRGDQFGNEAQKKLRDLN
ncbi:MAG: tetratricopeptide repeat protein [Ignavibacteriaceae bacterium]